MFISQPSNLLQVDNDVKTRSQGHERCNICSRSSLQVTASLVAVSLESEDLGIRKSIHLGELTTKKVYRLGLGSWAYGRILFWGIQIQ